MLGLVPTKLPKCPLVCENICFCNAVDFFMSAQGNYRGTKYQNTNISSSMEKSRPIRKCRLSFERLNADKISVAHTNRKSER
jgi:hypothetical protein